MVADKDTTGSKTPNRENDGMIGGGLFGGGLIVALTCALVISSIRPPYPEPLVLQHVPTVPAILILGYVVLRFGMTRLSMVSLATFLSLHILGARWIYTYVPYDDVACWISGQTITERFGWTRNHYDRLVHFASGVLLTPAIIEASRRIGRMEPIASSVMAFAGVMTIAAIYEIIEWQIAMTMSPATAESYNGQQGDVWDPQKDMALAMIGAVITCPCLTGWSASIDRTFRPVPVAASRS